MFPFQVTAQMRKYLTSLNCFVRIKVSPLCENNFYHLNTFAEKIVCCRVLGGRSIKTIFLVVWRERGRKF